MIGCLPLNDAQVQKVAAGLFRRNRALFITGVRTGFRITELLALTVGDVWDGQVKAFICVRSQNMKGNAPGRAVALHEDARKAIADWLLELQPKNTRVALFASRKGGSLDRKSAWRILNAAYKAAGIAGSAGQLGTHVMRKTFASKVHAKLGNDLLKTQKALGHKSILSTAAYLSFDESEITAAILAA